MDEELKRRRRSVLLKHFESEVAHDFESTVETFSGAPRYEIMPTGEVYEGKEAVIDYHKRQRTAFPDQRHENVRFQFSESAVIAEFDLLGTNKGEFFGGPPTQKAFRVPVVAIFFFEGDKIAVERVYLDTLSLLGQIGRLDLVAMLDQG